jgi:CheY-like chemotaxis protein
MEAVGQLAGGIAHDFNNLLTAILGYSDLLLDRVQSIPDVAADIEEIRKAGERASSLTSQLLAFSRKQVLQPQVLDLNAIVGDVQRMLRRVIGEDIRLETTAAPDLKRVLADAGQMHQVLMNLAVNARDAMPRGGTLRIETSNGTLPGAFARTPADEEAPMVVLTVADSGTGMTPEVRARVFEPFFTTKRPGKGTGLGLSMVYGVVTQTGGHIAIDSEPGGGTTIRIMLPAAADVDASEQLRTASAAARHGSETILLVEDEEPIRALVRKVLTSYGYDVLEAEDTAHALQIAESHPATIHLLLSDIVMPAMSGPELAQRLVSKRRHLRVLYMSGFLDRLGTSFGALSPGVSILHKPFTPDQLARRVRESLTGAAVLLAALVSAGGLCV